MAPKSPRALLEARKLLAELGALLGGADANDNSQTGRKDKMPTTASKTVRELALELPNATRVFEKLGIDYCCGGHKSLWRHELFSKRQVMPTYSCPASAIALAFALKRPRLRRFIQHTQPSSFEKT
jgi:hypothetical protein